MKFGVIFLSVALAVRKLREAPQGLVEKEASHEAEIRLQVGV